MQIEQKQQEYRALIRGIDDNGHAVSLEYRTYTAPDAAHAKRQALDEAGSLFPDYWPRVESVEPLD